MSLTPTPLPTQFLERLKNILSPENYDQYLSQLSTEKFTTFRVNTLKTRSTVVVANLEEQKFNVTSLVWCKDAFFVPANQRRALTETQLFKEGMIYIQNPSSLFASLVLDPQPGEEILDLAAAPGGKTLHIAQLMNNEGRIAAVEVVRERFFRLRANVSLAGATLVETYCKDGAGIGRLVPERFDRVLLDAPCSSEARFDPDDHKSFAFWSEKKIQDMSRKQKQLIYSAVLSLKPQGTLVYCTCSFAPEENEAIIQYALKKFGSSIAVVPFDVPFGNYQCGLSEWGNREFAADVRSSVRVIPDGFMSGFFVCKIVKGHS